MISRLVYVCCDRCGTPAHEDAMGDDARQARRAARRYGFVRRRRESRTEDLCPRCAAESTPDPR